MQMKEENNVNDHRMCRFCHAFTTPEDLIAPCACRGSVKWVHRSCLNTWRSVSVNPRSFFECDNCKTPYMIINRVEEGDECARVKFGALITRDFLVVFVLLNLLIFGLGCLAEFLCRNVLDVKDIVWIFPQTSFIADTYWTRVYCFGGLVLLFILGIVGIFYTCYMCCKEDHEEEEVRAESYHYHGGFSSFYWVYCGPYYQHNHYYCGPCGTWSCECCNCGVGSGNSCSGGNCSGGGNNDCSGSGDAGAALLGVVVVIVVAVMLVGLFFGVVMGSILAGKIIHRHVHVLALSRKTKLKIVANLEDPRQVAEAEEQREDISIEIPIPDTTSLLSKSDK